MMGIESDGVRLQIPNLNLVEQVMAEYIYQ